jgi:dipeptidyl aminopeptidase/acylaminoacyl peptidase
MLVAPLYFQLGVFLDYLTGEHSPSVSERLRQAMPSYSSIDYDTAESILKQTLPARAQSLFPQLLISSSWPPSILLHGTTDTAVPISEAREIHAALGKRGVRVELKEIEGEEHGFDLVSEAANQYGQVFGQIEEFIKSGLGLSAN